MSSSSILGQVDAWIQLLTAPGNDTDQTSVTFLLLRAKVSALTNMCSQEMRGDQLCEEVRTSHCLREVRLQLIKLTDEVRASKCI